MRKNDAQCKKKTVKKRRIKQKHENKKTSKMTLCAEVTVCKSDA